MKTYDLSYFLGKNVFDDHGSQNMFVYQLILSMLQLQTNKDTDYVIIWKSKWLFTSTPSPLHIASLNIIKLFECKMRVKFDKEPLTVEQKNYATKILNTYIVYELDTWPKISLNKFTLKNCLFGATNIV